MKISNDVSLKPYNTFGVNVQAKRVIQLETLDDLQAVHENQYFDYKKDLVLGGGSNVLFTKNYSHTILLNRLSGHWLEHTRGNDSLIFVRAGENWHTIVRWTTAKEWWGLENLSFIPGSVGAAPIQNIGAYGVELAHVLHAVEAWDWQVGKLVTLSNADCRFNYRDSVFKSNTERRYLITGVWLRVSQKGQALLNYPGVAEELERLGYTHPNPNQVSDAITRIRTRKLPDPAVLGNAGSFFKNPIVSNNEAERLLEIDPGMPNYPIDAKQTKLSAAWLIEQLGWKGYRRNDAGVSDKHALVLVNYANASGAGLWKLAQSIQKSVKKTYGINLQPEPYIVGQSSN